METREYEQSFALEGEHWWFRAKRALVRSLLHRYGWRGGRGLDVGCGTGGMLETLAAGPEGGTWTGVDAAPLALGFSRKRGLPRLTAGSAVALPFRSGVFDACLLLDVLYHRQVDSDVAALVECHRVLRRDGLLVITDSAYAWLRSGHDEARTDPVAGGVVARPLDDERPVEAVRLPHQADGDQSLAPAAFEKMMQQLGAFTAAAGRTLSRQTETVAVA